MALMRQNQLSAFEGTCQPSRPTPVLDDTAKMLGCDTNAALALHNALPELTISLDANHSSSEDQVGSVAMQFQGWSNVGATNLREKLAMRKSIMMPVAAVAIAVEAWMFLPMRGHRAAAQAGPYIVNAINLDIAPDQFDKFMDAAKENASASTKDPGCREFNIVVSKDDPHHIMFFEVYDNAAALDVHRATDHFKKYQAATKDMVTKRDAKQFLSVAMNMKGM